MDRRTLTITISILLGLNSAILADYLCIHIPIVRQIFGFIALMFLPGFLVVNILKLENLSWDIKLLLSIAISGFFAMIIGVVISILLPPFGINRPLSTMPLLATYNGIILLLAILSQKYYTPSIKPSSLSISSYINPIILFFIFLVPLTILSRYYMDISQTSWPLMTTLIIVVLSPIVFYKKIKLISEHGALIVLLLSAIVISHTLFASISSGYLWGMDIFVEYKSAKDVLYAARWSKDVFTPPTILNGMLSVNVLPVMYTQLMGIPLYVVFQYILAIFAIILPVALYRLYHKILKESFYAYLAVFYVLSLAFFFTENLFHRRQVIAEFYASLIILLMFLDMPKFKKRALMTIFGISMIFSHYGVSYIIIFSMLATAVLSKVMISLAKTPKKELNIPLGGVAIGIVTVFLYYIYMYPNINQSPLAPLIYIAYNIFELLKTGHFNPTYSQSTYLIVRDVLGLHKLGKAIALFLQFVLSVGIFSGIFNFARSVVKRDVDSDTLEYSLFSLILSIILGVSFLFSQISNSMSATRLYTILILFLTPYIIIGFKQLFNIVEGLSGKIVSISKKSFAGYWKATLIGSLILFSAFSMGIPYKIFNSPPWGWNIDSKADSPVFNIQDLSAAKWVVAQESTEIRVRSDQIRSHIFRQFIHPSAFYIMFPLNFKDYVISDFSYVYLNKKNFDLDRIVILRKDAPVPLPYPLEFSGFRVAIFDCSSKLYDNGYGYIYLKYPCKKVR